MTNILAKFKRASDLFEKRQNGSKTSSLSCSNPKSLKCPSTQPPLMLKITILGIALAAIALAGTMSVADSKTIPLSLTQERDGVQAHDILCSDVHVPMKSPSGLPVCVFEESVLKLEKRGFEFTGEPFDMLPIKSSNTQQGSAHVPASLTEPPVVSISMLPSINETAVVEITYTNPFDVNVTDNEDEPAPGFLSLGWVVSSGFEIVDSGGVEPWTMYADPNEPSILTYREFVPLDVGESKTYRIEVRAVNDGYGYVTGVGYGFSTARLSLYIDDEETLPYHEHRERYPAMHPVPERTPYAKSTELFPPLTDEERNAATEYVPPSRERLTDFFEAYFAGNDSKQDIGDAMDFVQQMGGHLNYTLTDIRQILGDAGYANDEIEAEWSTRSSSARSHAPSVLVSGQINIGQIPLGVGNTTFVNSAEACVNVTNRNTGNDVFLGSGKLW